MARRPLGAILLMEAVVSSCLLGLVAFFALSLFPSSSLLLHQDRFRGHALEFAQSSLESLEQVARPLPPVGSKLQPDHEFDGVVFHSRICLQSVAGEAPEQLLQARCQVSWKDALGNHQLELGNYLAQH